MSPPHDPQHSAGRTLAALLGALPAALACGLAFATLAPLEPPLRSALGAYSVFPGWTALSLWLFLAPTGVAAWRRAAALTLGGAALCALGLWLTGTV